MNPDPNDGSRPASRIAGGVILAAAVAVTVVALARLGPQDGLVFRGGPQLMALCWVVFVVAAIRHGVASRIMSTGVLRWLGTRSYAIYLFHWPLLELTDWHPLVVVTATLIAAEVSYRLVEMPVRLRSGRAALPVLGAAALAVALMSAATAVLSSPARAVGERASGADQLPAWTQEAPETPTATSTTSTPGSSLVEGSTTTEGNADVTSTEPAPPPETETTDATGTAEVPIITVLGDSSGLHLADGLRKWADANRLVAVVDHTRVGCSPLISEDRPWRARRIDPDEDDPIRWWIHEEPCRDDVIEPGTDLVLVVDHVNPQYEHQRLDGTWASMLSGDFAADIEDSYRKLLAKAHAADAKVVFATAPRLLSYYEVGIDHDPRRAEAYNSLVRGLVAEFESDPVGAGVALVDTAVELDASGHHGRYGRTDGVHLDFERSELFAAEILGPALLELLASG